MRKIAKSDPEIIDAMCDLALVAGAKALEIYRTDFAVQQKDDASPVTQADQLGEEIIVAGLKELAPAIPVLAEESASHGKIPALGEQFFLVDPIDGTKEFINKTDEFTVNIALIRNQRPALGVVYAPALRRLYAGIVKHDAWVQSIEENGVAGRRDKIAVRRATPDRLIAVASRAHRSPETDAFLKTIQVIGCTAAGSSLKFCLIAEGKADVYPRFGRTMEWDTGAGQAVLEAAGGRVVTHPDGEILNYGKAGRGFDNPDFIAWGAKRA